MSMTTTVKIKQEMLDSTNIGRKEYNPQLTPTNDDTMNNTSQTSNSSKVPTETDKASGGMIFNVLTAGRASKHNNGNKVACPAAAFHNVTTDENNKQQKYKHGLDNSSNMEQERPLDAAERNNRQDPSGESKYDNVEKYI